MHSLMNDDARINVRVALLPVMLCWDASFLLWEVGLNECVMHGTSLCADLVPLMLCWQVR